MASGTERLPLIGEAVEERSDEADEVRTCCRTKPGGVESPLCLTSFGIPPEGERVG
jgi:hypothetical protein